MKEQRSISVPGVTFENEQESIQSSEMSSKDIQSQIRPGTLYEVLMALKERER